jgi:hypothetical protein
MKKRQSDPLWVNQKSIACVFGVSPSTILNWVELPSRKQGRERLYFIPDCVQWLLERERSKLSSLTEEQARYARVRRERQELLLSRERGESVSVEDAKMVLTTLGIHLKGQLESFSKCLPGRLVAMDDSRKIGLLLRQETHDILASFHTMKFGKECPPPEGNWPKNGHPQKRASLSGA